MFGVLLTPGGTPAWIRELGSPAAGNMRREVVVQTASGERVVDSGPEIATDSLAISGSRLYWIAGSTARTAVIG